ncbi:hypothetical protein BSKO_05132 [Bryopsis sp. KO-2023]|nr:hypothetical protein BSKO_05132 [Bryopsis sp. KO-2023]
MLVSKESVAAFVLISLGLHGASCARRPDGEPCSFYNVDKNSSAGRRGGLGNRFQLATEEADLVCMREFHAAGDNVNSGNRFGATPVHSSAYIGSIDALKLLIEFGADLNRVHPLDGTALSAAGCRGFLEFVKVLLAAGADKSITNIDNESPLWKVCQCSSCSDATKRELRNLLGGGCSIISNFDFPSKQGILNNGKNDITSTNEECCTKCANNPSCKVWTRIKSSAGGSAVGECWLRSFRPAIEECFWCDSGVNSCGGILVNTDFPSSGGVLNDGSTDLTNSNAECCRRCNERSDCKAWTRIKKDTEHNKAGECWLRDTIPDRKFCAECDSGSKG